MISAKITKLRRQGTSNVIDAIEQHDHVYKIIHHECPKLSIEKMTAIKGPFLALTHLELESKGENPAVLPDPDSFMGGSAPRL